MNAVTHKPAGAVRLTRAQSWIAACLLLLLAAALLLPTLSVRMIDRAIDREVQAFGPIEPPSWLATELEGGFARLRETMQGAAEGRLPPEALVPALERFLEHKAQAEQSRASEAFRNSAAWRAAARELEQFLARAEPTLRTEPPRRIARVALANLLPQAAVVESLLHDYARHTAEAGTAMFIDHVRQVRRAEMSQNVVLVQGAMLVLLVLALGAVAWSAWVVRNRLAGEQAELAEALKQLRAAHEHMSAAHERETRFMANMSHEIRTPFQGLLGMLSLLEDAPLAPQHRRHLGAARDAAQHLLGIVNDILDVSAMESGHYRVSPEPVRLSDVVGDVVILMRAAAARKGLQLEMTLDAGLPEWVEVDPTRLRQVLFNLLGNSVKFTAQGLVNVRVRPDPQRSGFVQFRVSDTGIGMPREVVDNLFKPYFQADASISRRFGGTGLGLEISRRIAQLMGGDITVSSEVGYGSTFCVRLPLPALSAKRVPTEAPSLRAGRSLLSRPLGDATGGGTAPRIVPAGETPQPSLRLLVADDNDINLTYMDALLRRMGHEVVTCTNGAEAVQRARQGGFDAALLDVHMPVLDGLAAARAIRRMDFDCGPLKIALVTADVTPATREQAVASGVDAFVLKPVQQADLEKALRACGLLKSPADDPVIALSGEVDPHADAQTAQQLAAEVARAAAAEIAQTAAACGNAPPLDEHTGVAPAEVSPVAAAAELAPGAAARDERLDLLALQDSMGIMGAEPLRQMLTRLFDAEDDAVHALRRALRSSDWAAVRFCAHKLKGTALLLGLGTLGRVALQLEHDARGRLNATPASPSPAATSTSDEWLAQLDEALAQTRLALTSHGVLPALPQPATGGSVAPARAEAERAS